MESTSRRKSKRTRSSTDNHSHTKISTYFPPSSRNETSRKRSQASTESYPPPAKVSCTDTDVSPLTGQSAEVTPPPTAQSPKVTSVSPEQEARMEKNKLEAESKIIARKFGADKIGHSWMKALQAEFKKSYIDALASFLSEERSRHTVYPPPSDVFSWTLACPIHDVKVVMLGQDPYHGPGQAHGLCFSVRLGVATPPSLRNMYKELSTDVEGFSPPSHGYLMGWATQGVLLLNACLTVRKKEPNSHAGKGWEKLTDAVIHWLNDHGKNIVFLLWGAYAQKKGAFINEKKHCVLKSVHPSPLSANRGFIGCKHFSKANDYLSSVGKDCIDWKYLPSSIDIEQ